MNHLNKLILLWVTALVGCGGGEANEMSTRQLNAVELAVALSSSDLVMGESVDLILDLTNESLVNRTISFSLNGPGGTAVASTDRFTQRCVTHSLFVDQLSVITSVTVPAQTLNPCRLTIVRTFSEPTGDEFLNFVLNDPVGVVVKGELPRFKVAFP
jgi:hypothetical protein